MSVHPINYQASSKYEKSKTTTMKILLLFMFVTVTVAVVDMSEQQLTRTFSRMFRITPDQSRECIKKTGVTLADMRKMSDSMEEDVINNEDMKSVKTASCALVCGSQKQGIMVGKEIQLPELNEYFQQSELPKEVFDVMTNSASFCKDNVEEMKEDDVCMILYRFLKCMYKSLSVFGE